MRYMQFLHVEVMLLTISTTEHIVTENEYSGML